MQLPVVDGIREFPPRDFEVVFSLMRELRPHLDFAQFARLCEAARQADDYTLVGVEENGRPVAVMGMRLLHDLVHGAHLYIDDLVVAESHRSRGLGARLLHYAERTATLAGTKQLRLCTGIENEAGRRFYKREGWTERALAIKKRLD